MANLYICNTSSDYISKVNLDEFKEESKIILNNQYSFNKIGPHGIFLYKEYLFSANSYSNTISKIDIKKEEEKESHFVGIHCNDLVIEGNLIYIICGESNSIVLFDIITSKVFEEIPCGCLPHSIEIDRKGERIITTNMGDDSVTLIHLKSNTAKNIRVGPYPTKAVFTNDGEYALVCESNIGSEKKGSIGILSLKENKIINRVSVGSSPVDMCYCCKSKFCFVSNFGEGSISVIDINNKNSEKKITVGGMPRGIVKHENCLYVGDNYNNILTKIDILNGNKKSIPIGGEPTGMVIANYN